MRTPESELLERAEWYQNEHRKLWVRIDHMRGLMMAAAQQLEKWNTYVIICGHDKCGHTCSRVDDLIAELRKEALK